MSDGKLLSGQSLKPEDTLVSPGGQARLHYQNDGNLVVYLNGLPFWASHTDGYTAGKLLMQSDGNLVLYDADGPVMATHTQGHPGAMVQLQDDGNFVLYEDPHGPMAGTPIWASSTGSFSGGDIEPEPMPICRRPLIGPLRVEHKLLRDDTGLRRVLFCSWFPALRILRDTPQEFYRQLDRIAFVGYQGIRIFLAVGGWTPYWDGREVCPVGFKKWIFTGNHLHTDQFGADIPAWPDYDELLRTLLRACRSRKLRLHVTCGDMQIICPDPNNEIDLHRRFARICGEEGGTDVMALVTITNEFPINRYGGDSAQSIAQMGQVIQVWENAIPGILTGQGAIPANESVPSLEKASTHGDVCAVHVTRDPFATCLKHTFGLINFEGSWRHFPKPFWAGEPAGPGADSYARLDDPAALVALHAMHGCIGMGAVWFQGAGVRSLQPLESEWGFEQMPTIMETLPEDVANWDHGANAPVGGIMYFWQGNTFATSTMSDWNTTPPRPVASWTLHRGSEVISGTGNPPNHVTGMITGVFS